MAHVINLLEGSTTITLNSSNCTVLDYVPTVGDGVSVSETITVLIQGANQAALNTKIASIQRMLEQAANYVENNSGDKVYITSQPDGYATSYRSQIHAGRLVYDTDALDHPQWTRPATAGIHVGIVIERDDFWDGPVTDGILSNSWSGSKTNPDGVTIYNSASNYADIAGADVSGDMESPAILNITNADSSTYTRTFWIAKNSHSNPATLAYHFEGEDAAAGTDSTLTDTSDAGASGGYYTKVEWTETAEAQIMKVTLTNGFYLGAGNQFHIMLKLFAAFAYTDLWLRCRLAYPKVGDPTVLLPIGQDTPWKLMEAGKLVFDLGTMKLPPFSSTQGADLVLLLKAKRAGGASEIDVDFMQLLASDGWRIVTGEKFNDGSYDGVPVSTPLIDDAAEEKTYRYLSNVSSTVVPTFSGYGDQITLTPGKAQRLMVLIDDIDNAAASGRSHVLRYTYRPRRRSL